MPLASDTADLLKRFVEFEGDRFEAADVARDEGELVEALELVALGELAAGMVAEGNW